MKTSMCALLITSLISAIATGQQRFELVVPGSGLTSRAERTDERLRIEDSQGNATVYQRAPRYDSTDGGFLAYSSPAARQVIRWPVSDQGRLQIATISSPAALEFRRSQMEIRPLMSRPAATFIENIRPDAAYRLVPEVPDAAGSVLATNSAGRLILAAMAEEDSQVWHVNPVATGVFRIHSDARGRGWSLANLPENALRLVPTSNSTDQLWNFVAAPGNPGRFALASLRIGPTPLVLTWTAGGCAIRPRMWSVNQLWQVVPLNRGLPPVFAEYVFSSRELQPNPPLQPANVELTNSHSKELWVLLVDRALSNGGTRVKIPPSGSITISLERDAGATLLEVYERTVPFVGVQREEFATPIPPASRYDLSVYEVIVQSIAIDRTAKGRGKLEDVQYAPRSLGWFELPPQLNDGPLDVYEAAKSQENPGQVRRLDLKQWQSQPTTPDPVESLLNKVQANSPQ